MKRILLAVAIIAQFGFSQVADATVMTYNDDVKIWSGWTNSVVDSNSGWAQNDVDSIGSPQVVTTTVDQSNGILSSITFNVLYALPANVYAGDLFINLLTSSSDTTWDYVVRSYNSSNGTYNINAVSVDAVKQVSNPYEMSFYDANLQNYRSLTPIGVQSQYLGADVGDATLSGLNTNHIKYDFGNGFDTQGFSYIIGWTETCGNDVIYQQVPVPEPGTMMLLGLGMLGMAVYGKRRMNKEA